MVEDPALSKSRWRWQQVLLIPLIWLVGSLLGLSGLQRFLLGSPLLSRSP